MQPMEDDTKTNPHSSSPPIENNPKKENKRKTRIKTITINIERAR